MGMNRMMASLLDEIHNLRRDSFQMKQQVEQNSTERIVLRRVVCNVLEETEGRLQEFKDKTNFMTSKLPSQVQSTLKD